MHVLNSRLITPCTTASYTFVNEVLEIVAYVYCRWLSDLSFLHFYCWTICRTPCILWHLRWFCTIQFSKQNASIVAKYRTHSCRCVEKGGIPPHDIFNEGNQKTKHHAHVPSMFLYFHVQVSSNRGSSKSSKSKIAKYLHDIYIYIYTHTYIYIMTITWYRSSTVSCMSQVSHWSTISTISRQKFSNCEAARNV